jgi:hypothetical protein
MLHEGDMFVFKNGQLRRLQKLPTVRQEPMWKTPVCENSRGSAQVEKIYGEFVERGLPQSGKTVKLNAKIGTAGSGSSVATISAHSYMRKRMVKLMLDRESNSNSIAGHGTRYLESLWNRVCRNLEKTAISGVLPRTQSAVNMQNQTTGRQSPVRICAVGV